MEKDSKAAKISKRRRLFGYLLSFSAILIVFAFVFYQFLVGQAFGDRGFARNSVPTHHTSGNKFKTDLLKSANESFKCSNSRTVDISHFNSVGMFPYLFENGPEYCNKASDFVGYNNFISAMLHGEKHPGVPAKHSTKNPSSINRHHPGLEGLKDLLDKNLKYDKSVEFYWWFFPIPMGIPNRGFSYAIFQGDIKGLQVAAKAQNLVFEDLILESYKVFFNLQGWNIETSKPIVTSKHSTKLVKASKTLKYSFDERDHVVTKAWISLKCFTEYPETSNYNSKIFSKYLESLQVFMEKYLIRYPADFTCISISN